MAFQTQDGMRSYGSKFRASRYNRENSNPSQGTRSESHELNGKPQGKPDSSGSSDSAPNADSRLHNNPHSEKFNMPLDGPKAGADTQEMGEEQGEAHDAHTVTCPNCGHEMASPGASDAPPEPHEENSPSETEQNVKDDKVAKGVWKPGQREHPDAEYDPDFEPSIL